MCILSNKELFGCRYANMRRPHLEKVLMNKNTKRGKYLNKARDINDSTLERGLSGWRSTKWVWIDKRGKIRGGDHLGQGDRKSDADRELGSIMMFIKVNVKRMLYSNMGLFSQHNSGRSGVNIGSSMNHQHFNAEEEGASVARNKIKKSSCLFVWQERELLRQFSRSLKSTCRNAPLRRAH